MPIRSARFLCAGGKSITMVASTAALSTESKLSIRTRFSTISKAVFGQGSRKCEKNCATDSNGDILLAAKIATNNHD